MDVDGKPEQVHIYLCFTHGFYTFRLSEGLTHGFGRRQVLRSRSQPSGLFR
jgi:hypothetical protein